MNAKGDTRTKPSSLPSKPSNHNDGLEQRIHLQEGISMFSPMAGGHKLLQSLKL